LVASQTVRHKTTIRIPYSVDAPFINAELANGLVDNSTQSGHVVSGSMGKVTADGTRVPHPSTEFINRAVGRRVRKAV
jgi:hypothetical protein